MRRSTGGGWGGWRAAAWAPVLALAACGLVERPAPAGGLASGRQALCESIPMVRLGEVVGGLAGCAGCATPTFGLLPPADGLYQLLLLRDGGPVGDEVDLGVRPAQLLLPCDGGLSPEPLPPHSVAFRGYAGWPWYAALLPDRETPYQFTILAVPPAPGDTCDAPLPVLPGQPLVVDLRTAVNDLGFGGCSTRLAPDVVLSLTAPTAGRYQLATSAGTLAALPACGASCTAAGQGPSLSFDLAAGEQALAVLSSMSSFATVRAAPVLPPANDTCAGAAAVGPGQRVAGTTRGAAADGLCQPGVVDVAYRFQAPDGGVFQARVLVDGGTPAGLLVSAAAACGDPAVPCAGAEVASFQAGAGEPVSLVVGNRGLPLDFELVVEPLARAPNDTCAAPAPLALGAPLDVSFASALDDFAGDGGCGVPASADLASSFTAPSAGRYGVTTSAGRLFGSGAACGASCGDGARAVALDLGAGATGFVLLEAEGASTARLAVTPPPVNDGCAGALPLVAGVPRVGTTASALPDVCGGYPDVVYRFVPPVTGNYQISVQTPSGGPVPGTTAWPALVRGACPGGPCVAADFAPTLGFHGTAGEARYLVVSAPAGVGEFQVVVQPRATPPGDTCETAPALTPGTPLTMFLDGALDDYGLPGTCGEQYSPDVVAAFTPPATAVYRFRHDPYTTNLFLGTGSCGAAPCSQLLFDPSEVSLRAGIPAWLVAETRSGAATLSVEQLPQPPNAACAQALPIALGEVALGTVAGAPTLGCFPGPSVIYRFTPPTRGLYRARGSYGFPVSLVGAPCDWPASCPAVAPADAEPGWQGWPGRPQLLAVSWSSFGSGPDFTLRVERLTVPANDACPGSRPLVLGQPGGVVLDQGQDDYRTAADGGCGLPGELDAVFFFTAPNAGRYLASSSGFLSAGPGPCGLACPARGYQPLELTLDGGETAFLVVDGAGPQWVKVELLELAAPGGTGGGGGQGHPAGCGCRAGGEAGPLALTLLALARRRGAARAAPRWRRWRGAGAGLAALAALLLGACAAPVELAVSPPRLEVAARADAPAPADLELEVTARGAVEGTPWLRVAHGAAGIRAVTVRHDQPLHFRVTVALRAPSALAPGSTGDTLGLALCAGLRCERPLATSAVRLSYQVTPAPAAVPVAVRPVLDAVAPRRARAGTGGYAGIPLTLTGSGFVPTSVARWGGDPRPTTLVSRRELTALLTAADLATTRAVLVTVSNEAVDGGTSEGRAFQVFGPEAPPLLESLAPGSASIQDPGLTLVVGGFGFDDQARVEWNGSPLDTLVASESSASATVPASLLAAPGTALVTVRNSPAGNGTVSNAVPFQVTP